MPSEVHVGEHRRQQRGRRVRRAATRKVLFQAIGARSPGRVWGGKQCLRAVRFGDKTA